MLLATFASVPLQSSGLHFPPPSQNLLSAGLISQVHSWQNAPLYSCHLGAILEGEGVCMHNVDILPR